jgi:uncharacterized surface protein with fasciclin (FAS1) repeats
MQTTRRSAQAPVRVPNDLMAIAGGIGRFATLHRALCSTGVADALYGAGPFTLFAPTNAAFAKLGDAEREWLFADRDTLARLMRHHVATEPVAAPKVGVPRQVVMLDGGTVQLTTNDGRYHVNSARIIRTGIAASNGVIHAIDTLLLPTPTSGSGTLRARIA